MRESAVLLLVLVLSTAPAAAVLLPVKAVSKTIVVPDDYTTIGAALGNATAGDTVFVREGTYEEKTLVISKMLSLIGEDANNTIVNLHPPYNTTTIITQVFVDYAHPITIEANDVKISGFTIASDGGEILITGNGIQIIGNTISTALSMSGSNNTLAGNVVLKPIILGNANSNAIRNNTLASITLGYNYQPCLNNVISGNKIEGPGSFGIYILGSSNNVFYANYLANFQGSGSRYSGYGVVFAINSISENNTFYHNTLINNKGTVAVKDGEFAACNFWDNGEEGNYWDDYNGTDSNRDGIGDTPYVISDGNNDNYPLMMPYDMENNTIVRPPPEPFPIVLVVAAVAPVAVAVLCVFVYLKKRNG